MNQPAILQALDEMLPDLRTTSSASAVITKYARDHNLAPAQLAQLAQTCNIVRSISYMDKNAGNRGATFDLLEPSQLVSDYCSMAAPHERTGHFTLPKAAARLIDPDNIHDWAEDLVTEKRSTRVFRDMHVEAFPVAVPAAPQEDPYAELLKAAREGLRTYFTDKHENYLVQQITANSDDDLREFFDKVANLVREGHNLTEIEEDFITNRPDAYELVDSMTRYVDKVTRIKSARWAGPDKRLPLLPRDRFNLVADLDQAINTWETKEAAQAYSKEAATKTKENIDDYTDSGVWSHSGFQRGTLVDPGNSNSANASGDSAPQGKGPVSVGDPADLLTPAVRHGERQFIDPSRGKEKDGDKDKDDEGVASLLSKGFKGVNAQGGKAHGKLKEIVQSFAPKRDSGRQAIDTATDDALMDTTAKRLMISDPIISQAEPDKVLSLINSVRSASPAAARDPNLLRYILREALQYDGAMPTHSYKDLQDIEDASGSNRERGLKLDDSIYRLGGGGKPKPDEDGKKS